MDFTTAFVIFMTLFILAVDFVLIAIGLIKGQGMRLTISDHMRAWGARWHIVIWAWFGLGVHFWYPLALHAIRRFLR